MKYKVYYKGDAVKVYHSDNTYILNMGSTSVSPSCPVSTGGSIELSNGDILHINEEYGVLEHWGDDYHGIGIALDSGNATISYLLISNNVGTWPQAQESGFGTFFDLNNKEYLEGNILKIYGLEESDLYDLSSIPYEMYWQESRHLMYGISCIGVIVIKNGNWVLTNEPKYVGQTITISDEEIYISGPCMEDGIGIYFTLSSGRKNTSYYIRDGETLAHSSNNWFSAMIPEDGDEIHMYFYDDGGDYGILENDYSEENARQMTSSTYSLTLVNGRWVES